jgi:hypothetical protein
MAEVKRKYYCVNENFSCPKVMATNNPRNPMQITNYPFKKGQIITGEMMYVQGKPSFLFVKQMYHVPLSKIKEIQLKDIDSSTGKVSNATGEPLNGNAPAGTVKKIEIKDNPNAKYLDSIVIGAVIGFGATYYAEKKGWLPEGQPNNRYIGAGVGALALTYLAYRLKTKNVVK